MSDDDGLGLGFDDDADFGLGGAVVRDEPTATMALALLNGHDLCGRPLRVGRPAGYTDMGGAPEAPTAASLGAPSYIPPPPAPEVAPRPPPPIYESVEEPELLG